MINMIRRLLSLVVVLPLLQSGLAQSPPGKLIGSQEPGWPQFRGPGRDGISHETGLLQAWPEGGPKVIWQVPDIGRGYSSPVIIDDLIYITGDVNEQLVIFAFDLNGKLKWKTVNGKAWAKPYPGARASCTYDDGLLYHMNAHGRLVCLDPSDGREIWDVNILERFDAPNIKWAISECLLIDGDRIIVSPGGKKALVAALNKKTGETVWAGEPLHFQRTHKFGGMTVDPPQPDIDKAGYAAPILVEIGGKRLIASCSARHLYCVDADTGKLWWRYPVYARWEVIGTMPVQWGDGLFFSAPDEFGGKMFRVKINGDKVDLQEKWSTPIDNCHGAFVLVDDRLYGAGHRRFKGWGCVDIATGKLLYQDEELVKGCAVHADGRLYVLSESGLMSLINPTDQGFETVGSFTLVEKKVRDAWAHPVILDGRLYLRFHENFYCYDIKAP